MTGPSVRIYRRDSNTGSITPGADVFTQRNAEIWSQENADARCLSDFSIRLTQARTRRYDEPAARVADSVHGILVKSKPRPFTRSQSSITVVWHRCDAACVHASPYQQSQAPSDLSVHIFQEMNTLPFLLEAAGGSLVSFSFF